MKSLAWTEKKLPSASCTHHCMGDIAMHVTRRESAGVLPGAGLHPEVTPQRGCRNTGQRGGLFPLQETGKGTVLRDAPSERVPL